LTDCGKDNGSHWRLMQIFNMFARMTMCEPEMLDFNNDANKGTTGDLKPLNMYTKQIEMTPNLFEIAIPRWSMWEVLHLSGHHTQNRDDGEYECVRKFVERA